MANEHIKRYLVSSVIREKQMETTVRCHKMARVPKMDNNKRWWGCGETGTFTLWAVKLGSHFVKILWQFFRNWTQLPSDPAVPRLGTCPKELEACLHKNWAQRFMAALLIRAQKWKQLECSSTEESIKCGPSTRGVLLGRRRNEVLTHATTWRTLETWCWLKAARHHRPRVVWFRLWEASRIQGQKVD